MEENKTHMILALRVVQLLCLCSIITGFIWSSSDFLLVEVLADAPVTPLSILMMLYGLFGWGLSEGIIRVLTKKKP